MKWDVQITLTARVEAADAEDAWVEAEMIADEVNRDYEVKANVAHVEPDGGEDGDAA